MAETRRLRELTQSATARLALPDGPLAVALSGGADSAALAFLCVEAGRRPRALHVNHGLPDSDLMETAAVSIAETLGLELEVVTVSVPEGASPEGQARRVRYEAFADASVPGEALLTAHTLDDNAETILLNLIRGTGSRGLSGIPYRQSFGVYRPALDLSRSEAREIATLAGLAFIDDPMNHDQTLSRSWLRTVVMPTLRELNPRLSESLRRAGDHVAKDAAHLDQLARTEAPNLGEGTAKHPRACLLTAPEAVADRVIMLMLEHVMGEQSVSSERMERTWGVVRGHSARQELGRGALAEMVGPMLVISSEQDEPDTEARALTPGTHRIGRFEFEVREASGRCRVLPLSNWAAVFPRETELAVDPDGSVSADGQAAWVPGQKRFPVAWYEPGSLGYLSVKAREGTGWTSSH